MSTSVSSSPSTPTTQRFSAPWVSAPTFSSPLASPPSSPSSAAQERRALYKGQLDATPTKSRHRTFIKLSSTRRRQTDTQPRCGQPTPSADDPQKAFLRERFRARCLERAARDRERKIKGKRPMLSEPSSDMECEDEDEDEEEAVLNDELFRRIMASVEHKRKHAYRVSYSYDVGSSYDPSIEEEIEWENELKGDTEEVPGDTGPVDLTEEELEELAAEQELLEGLDPDDIFSLSDLDEPSGSPTKAGADDDNEEEIQWRHIDKGKQRAYTSADGDVDMDL